MHVDCLKSRGKKTEGASVFMSNRILVTPEQLEQVSTQFAQSGQLSDDMVERLQRSIHEMEGQWQGMTRERFFGDYQQARATMIKFVECLQSISTELKQISVKFRSTDEMVNGAAAGGVVAGAGILAGRPPEPESPRQMRQALQLWLPVFLQNLQVTRWMRLKGVEVEGA